MKKKIMKPNFKLATTKAYEILMLNRLPLPIDLYKIKFENTKIHITSMQEWSKKYDIPMESLTQNGQYNEGYNEWHIKNGVVYAIIFYNDEIESKERKRFTIAHEIGHIVLRHKGYSEINEKEADTFAAQLLLPHCILEELIRRGKNVTESYLTEKFGLSKEAASISKMQVGKKITAGAENEFEDIILELYKEFIDLETYNAKYRYYEEDLEMDIIRGNW